MHNRVGESYAFLCSLKDDDSGKAAMTELIQQEARAVSSNEIKGIGILFVCVNNKQ